MQGEGDRYCEADWGSVLKKHNACPDKFVTRGWPGPVKKENDWKEARLAEPL